MCKVLTLPCSSPLPQELGLDSTRKASPQSGGSTGRLNPLCASSASSSVPAARRLSVWLCLFPIHVLVVMSTCVCVCLCKCASFASETAPQAAACLCTCASFAAACVGVHFYEHLPAYLCMQNQLWLMAAR